MSPHSSYMILQTHTFYYKIISISIICYSYDSFYFLHTPLHGLAYYTLSCQVMLVSFISQQHLHGFQYYLYYSLSYACTTSMIIFRLILPLTVTIECNLHSRVKDSITRISIISFSSNI